MADERTTVALERIADALECILTFLQEGVLEVCGAEGAPLEVDATISTGAHDPVKVLIE